MTTLRDQKNWRVKDFEGEEALMGKRGVIRMSGNDHLDIWVLNTRIAKTLELTWKAKNHYDDGALFIRPWSDLDEAAKALKCSKRWYLSPERKAKAIEHLRQNRFQRNKDAVKQPFGDLIPPNPTQSTPEAQ